MQAGYGRKGYVVVRLKMKARWVAEYESSPSWQVQPV